ncbi:MAG: ATP-binding protein [Planctomycetia bacterium]|nr:ATP-binding protein [Planctomycetia bacterium]
MANLLKMTVVQSILSLHAQRWSRRRIATALGIDRGTVGRYLRQAPRATQPDAAESSKPAIAPTGAPGAIRPAEAAPARAESVVAGRQSNAEPGKFSTLGEHLVPEKISGLTQTLDVRLQEAAGHDLSHAEFLELILQDELVVRDARQIQRRVKVATFRELKPLDLFEWSFNPSLPKKQVFDLATCRFVREHRDALLIGPPGTGKPSPT